MWSRHRTAHSFPVLWAGEMSYTLSPKSGKYRSSQMTSNSTNPPCLDVWNSCPSYFGLYTVCAFVVFKDVTLVILSL